MRVPVNIASRPADNTRFLRLCAMFLGILTLILAVVAVRSEVQSRNEFRTLVDRTSELEGRIRDLEASEKEMRSWLETPQVLQIRKRSALLNALIQQKSLSWTRLFQDLESTLPAGVRITSIQPQTQGTGAAQGQPDLGLAVAAGSVGPIVEFIRRLEDSPEFANPVVGSQRFPDSADEEAEVEVSLTARYVQTLQAAPEGGAALAPEAEESEPEAEPQARTSSTLPSQDVVAADTGARR